MKKYFITGLVILLPLALTLAIVFFIFNLLTVPFVGIFKSLFSYFGLFQAGFLFLSADQMQTVISQIMILVLLFFSTVGLGLLARWFFFHYLIRIWEYIVNKIPFIRSVYKTCQDIITTIFTTDTKSFKQVVMVPFPSKETMAIGLVTKENLPPIGKSKQEFVAVFVPTTPNPTSGYLMMYQEGDVVYLDMTVEDALKYVISCGVISAPINQLSKQNRMNQQEESPDQLSDEP